MSTLYESIPATALCVNICGLFGVNGTFKDCQTLEGKTALKDWIKIEQVVFAMSILSILVYLMIYRLFNYMGFEGMRLYD